MSIMQEYSKEKFKAILDMIEAWDIGTIAHDKDHKPISVDGSIRNEIRDKFYNDSSIVLSPAALEIIERL